MLTPDHVTAVIVTRGDVDLTPVLDSLIFDDVIVWDNSREPFAIGEWRNGAVTVGTRLAAQALAPQRDLAVDEMTWGRALAAELATTNVVYSQDDDIIHTPENQQAIIAAYEPGVLVGCMWDEWSAGAKKQGIEDGYDDLVFCGSGSVYDRDLPFNVTREYLTHFPLDDFFRLWADTIIGVCAPTKQLDIRFDALPCAEDDNRMCNLPDAVANKTEAIKRARWVRDEKWVRATA